MRLYLYFVHAADVEIEHRNFVFLLFALSHLLDAYFFVRIIKYRVNTTSINCKTVSSGF